MPSWWRPFRASTIDDHVDGQVIAGVDFEVGANTITQFKALPFEFPFEGRVLEADDLWNAHQFAHQLQAVNPPEGSEHLAQFEGQQFVTVSSDLPIGFH